MGLVIVPWNRGHYILYICIIVFLRLVSTTFWAPIYQFLLHLIYHFGDQNFETDDYVVCAFLEFGWPIGLHYTSSLSTDQFSRNHKGATDFPSAVDSYLSLELERGAVIGPFSSNPFSHLIVISPLNSVPKPQSFERQMILELSWPSGTSINDAIPDQVYLLLPGISRQHPYSWAIWDFLVRWFNQQVLSCRACFSLQSNPPFCFVLMWV